MSPSKDETVVYGYFLHLPIGVALAQVIRLYACVKVLARPVDLRVGVILLLKGFYRLHNHHTLYVSLCDWVLSFHNVMPTV